MRSATEAEPKTGDDWIRATALSLIMSGRVSAYEPDHAVRIAAALWRGDMEFDTSFVEKGARSMSG